MAVAKAVLDQLTDDELIARQDEVGSRTGVSFDYYQQELERRYQKRAMDRQEELNKQMLQYTRNLYVMTKWIIAFTLVATTATIIQAVAAVMGMIAKHS